MTTSQTSSVDFTGHEIYVGMDVHKKSWSLSVHTKELEHKTFTQEPDSKRLVHYLRRTFPGATYHCVYEAGYSGFWIHEQLKALGVDCRVVNPADVPMSNKDRNFKTDTNDCRTLARRLKTNDLTGIYVPPRDSQEDRTLVRTRQEFVNKQTRVKNQIKAFLSFYGIVIPQELEESHWSNRFLLHLESLELTRITGTTALKAHLGELRALRKTILNLTQAIRTLSRTDDYRADIALLMSIPGIGLTTAMTFLTEIVDINRFPGLDELASFVGIAPGSHSSGESEHITGMSHRGNAHLRHLLIESAWTAARRDPVLLKDYSNYCKRTTPTKAIVKIARKVLARMRFVLKKQTPYVSLDQE